MRFFKLFAGSALLTGLLLPTIVESRADVFNMGTGFTSLQFVTVGNPANSFDSATGSLYGSVGYTYNIGKFEITSAQYCEFLNAVGSTDYSSNILGLYDLRMATDDRGCKIQRTGTPGTYSYSVAAALANRPVNYVSWGDAVRFCNWLQNGQPINPTDLLKSTEDGAYYLNGAMNDTSLLGVTRKSNAKYYLPTENEWYKAAYYDPNKPGGADYYSYPTKNFSAPSNTLSATGTNNANFTLNGSMTIGSPYYRTEVGAFANSPSAYNTCDQGGNVDEWNEAKIDNKYRGFRGGSFSSTSNILGASTRNYTVPTGASATLGFRIASYFESNVTTWIGGTGDTSIVWGYANNWNPGTIPDGMGTKVGFGSQSADCSIVDMATMDRTVGCLSFAAITSTTIRSTFGHSLFLDNNGIASTIDVAGTHAMTVPVIMKNNTTVKGTGRLSLQAGIRGPHALTVLGNLQATSINVDSLVIGSAPSSAQAVPEPSCLVLIISGGLGLLAWAWRRKKIDALVSN